MCFIHVDFAPIVAPERASNLKAAGVPAPRRRRPPRHRRRRDRYPREGMLLQIDASRHDWLEGRGPILSLLGAIDDATGRVTSACFREQEDAQGYFEVMRETVRRLGIPMAAYADRHSIFVQTQEKQFTLEEQLSGRRQPTQFGRLLEELGVQLIYARSPQAEPHRAPLENLPGPPRLRATAGSGLQLDGCQPAPGAASPPPQPALHCRPTGPRTSLGGLA
jgi:hypothetical protein